MKNKNLSIFEDIYLTAFFSPPSESTLWIYIFTGGILFWREDSVYGLEHWWNRAQVHLYSFGCASLFNIRAQNSVDDGVKKSHMILYHRVIVVVI